VEGRLLGVLVNGLLGFFLLGLEEGADPFEDIGAQDEGGGHDRLAARNIAFSAAFLVFIIVGLERPFLGVASLGEGPVDVAHDGALDVLGLGLDNGDLLVELAEELVAELIGLGDIGLCIGSRGFEVRQGGLDELGVACVGQVDGFGAIRILLDGADGV